MNKVKKGIMLVEISVLIICAFILFNAVVKVMESQNAVTKQIVENNNIMMLFDSIEAKIKYDIKSGKSFDDIDLKDIGYMIYNTPYQIIVRKENDKIEILLGVYQKFNSSKFGDNPLSKVYKKEVKIDE